MTNKLFFPLLLLFAVATGCSKSTTGLSDAAADTRTALMGPSGSSGQGGSGGQPQAGVITAGEWNDLDNWTFLNTLLGKEEFRKWPGYWHFNLANRVSVSITGTDASPVTDVVVKLKKNGATIFTARTDNKGNAELWVDLYQDNPASNLSNLTLDINNGSRIISNVKFYNEGINKISISPINPANTIDIAFVVDATGSMGDELEYLKTELYDVIARVQTSNPQASLETSAVFYRDEGDAYITKVSGFTSDPGSTINFIKNQRAEGGGDFPEAVHSAMEKAVGELQWAASAKTRLLFLVLDAPPHYTTSVIGNLQTSVSRAAEKGIKIIPVTASGIDKETEFLMRFISATTNGTYVFITNHSGIGNNHLEPTVGEYKVEFLNNLMVRLINKYAQ